MKALNPISTLISRRPVQLVALGVLAFAAQAACSGEPAAPPTNNFPTAGSSTGGTPGASGSTSTAGSFSTSGSTFGTAGTPAGGTGGAGAGGTGGTGGGTGGTAGTGGTVPIVVVPPYCEGKTPTPLPFDVQEAFFESQWQGDFSQIAVPTVPPTATPDLTEEQNACATRPPGAVGRCSRWRYTPNATAATWAAVAWVNRADANYTHPPVCLATGATRISFWARGLEGGEVVTFGGANSTAVAITLTDEWQEYEIPLAGVTYTTPDGIAPDGFSWKVDPAVPPEETPVTTFFIDSIQFVTTPLVGNGEGGSGAGGDSGMGGGEN